LPIFWKSSLAPILAGVGATLFSLLVLWVVIFFDEKSRIEQESKEISGEISKILIDMDAAFQDLGSIKADSCNEALLSELRLILFKYRSIQEILHFGSGNRSKCSATLGEIESPVVIDSPGMESTQNPGRFYSGANDVEINEEISAHGMMREGEFGLFVHPTLLFGLGGDYKWQGYLIHRDGTYRANFYGAEELYLDYERDYLGLVLRGYVISRVCTSNRADWCVVAKAEPADVISANSAIFGTGITLALILGFASYRFGCRKSEQNRGNRARVLRAMRTGNGFFPVYQPIVNLMNGEVVGCEVLARFEDADGKLFPDVIIPLIEQEKLTWKFTENILLTAFVELSVLAGMQQDFKVSVNFFLQDLDNRYLERLRTSSAIAKARRLPGVLNVELLESQLVSPESMTESLAELRASGFSIAIDDFGTGYSNLSQVKKIKADYLKIDRSFIQDIGSSGHSVKSSLVPHILEIADALNIGVIAEGIENSEQLYALKGLGVKFGQGYFLGRPAPVRDFAAYLDKTERLAI